MGRDKLIYVSKSKSCQSLFEMHISEFNPFFIVSGGSKSQNRRFLVLSTLRAFTKGSRA